MQLEFAAARSRRCVDLAPLDVAQQTVREAEEVWHQSGILKRRKEREDHRRQLRNAGALQCLRLCRQWFLDECFPPDTPLICH